MVSSFMPIPVSETERRTYLPGFPNPWVFLKDSSSSTANMLMVSEPPFGMASLAFGGEVDKHLVYWAVSSRVTKL